MSWFGMGLGHVVFILCMIAVFAGIEYVLGLSGVVIVAVTIILLEIHELRREVAS